MSLSLLFLHARHFYHRFPDRISKVSLRNIFRSLFFEKGSSTVLAVYLRASTMLCRLTRVILAVVSAHNDCPAGEVQLQIPSGRHLVQISTAVPSDSLRHVPCQAGYTGAIALTCTDGKLEVVSETCKPVEQELCSIFLDACH